MLDVLERVAGYDSGRYVGNQASHTKNLREKLMEMGTDLVAALGTKMFEIGAGTRGRRWGTRRRRR